MLKRTLFAALAVLAFGAGSASAAAPATYTVSGNLAVGGYDPVTYFTEGKAVKGDAQFTLVHNGANYRFASAADRDAFKADPAKYAPQYGGYCAWALAMNRLAPGKPQFWAVVDGKLYLNFSADVQKKWNADRPGFIAKANANWPSVLEHQSLGFFGLF